jgi:hypothetical protein
MKRAVCAFDKQAPVTLLWSIRITTGTRTSTLSYRSRAIMGGGRKASIVGFPLAWRAGGIGVNPPAIIA